MATNVLTEFLVSIGWKDDEVGRKKIVDSVERIGKDLVKLTVAAEAAALGITAALAKMAQGFENAYYQSARTGSSVKELNAFKYAASQMGSSAEEAAAAVENLALKIRENRGYRNLVKSLGVDVEHGAVRMYEELGSKFAAMSSERAHATASMLGLPERELLALMKSAEYKKFEDEYNARAGAMGVDLQKAAEDGKNLTRQFRSLWQTINLIIDAAATPLFSRLDGPIKTLNDYLTVHGKEIADIIGKIAGAILGIVTEVAKLLPDADKFAEKMGGWNVVLTTMAAIISAAFVARMAGLLGTMRGLSLLAMPPWVLALLGVGIGAAYGADYLNKHVHDGDASYDEAKRDQAEGGGSVRKWWRKTMPGFLGGGMTGNDAIRERGRKAKLGRLGSAVPYNAESMEKAGFSKDEYAAFKEGLTDIEGKDYGRMGGAGGRYAGRYQMGPAEITETAQRLGVPRPTNEQFLRDPAMQERFMENYTLDHYNQLMANPKFAALSRVEKLKMLGYAHNQGVGSRRRGTGAMGYLDSGRVGSDGFGTPGTAYFGPIERHLRNLPQRTPPMARPKKVPGPGDRGYIPPMPANMPHFDPSHPMMNPAPLGPGGTATNDNSKSVIINNNQKTEIHGVSDGQKAADHVGNVGDRHQSLLLRNLQSAVG